MTSTAATLNGSANPNLAAATGWFRYSTTNPGTCNDTLRHARAGDRRHGARRGHGRVRFSQATDRPGAGDDVLLLRDRLERASARRFGAVMSFTTPAAPTVTTRPATGVTSTDGDAQRLGEPEPAPTRPAGSATARRNPGTCNDTLRHARSGDRRHRAGRRHDRGGRTRSALTGLRPGTTYYYCAIAQNSLGTALRRGRCSFTTPAPPTVTTPAATAVTQHGGDAQRLGEPATARDRPAGSATPRPTRAPATTPSARARRRRGGTASAPASPRSPFSQPLTGLTPGDDVLLLRDRAELGRHGLRRGAVVHDAGGADRDDRRAATDGRTGTARRSNGSANPNARPTTGWFRYGTTDPGTCDDIFGTRAPATGGARSAPAAAAVPLLPGDRRPRPGDDVLLLRDRAERGGHVASARSLSFTTPAAPTVTTDAATERHQHRRRRSTARPTRTARRRHRLVPLRHDRSGHLQRQLRHARARRAAARPRHRQLADVTFSQEHQRPDAGDDLLLLRDRAERARHGASARCCRSPRRRRRRVTTLAAPRRRAPRAPRSTARRTRTARPRRAGSATTRRTPATCNDTFGTRAPAAGGAVLGAGVAAAPFSQSLTRLDARHDLLLLRDRLELGRARARRGAVVHAPARLRPP